ncbi:hypothetical protein T439DRAFT_323599 [Meredithblackwellia eburnea MCA 4105]
MPGNKVHTLKKLQSRKGNISAGQVHPNSRRAKQLQRVQLRDKKLQLKNKVRRSTEISKVDRHVYFVQALPQESSSISLPELHQLVHDYIARNDQEAQELATERESRAWRKKEGKSKRELEIDQQKKEELSEYRAGFVLPDLTLATNVFLCRQWVNPLPNSATTPNSSLKGGDPNFLPRIRMVRLSSEDKSIVTVAHEGAREGQWEAGQGELEMDDGDEGEDGSEELEDDD